MEQLIFMLIFQTRTLLSLLGIKRQLLGDTVAQPTPYPANKILENATIAVPLKYLSTIW